MASDRYHGPRQTHKTCRVASGGPLLLSACFSLSPFLPFTLFYSFSSSLPPSFPHFPSPCSFLHPQLLVSGVCLAGLQQTTKESPGDVPCGPPAHISTVKSRPGKSFVGGHCWLESTHSPQSRLFHKIQGNYFERETCLDRA